MLNVFLRPNKDMYLKSGTENIKNQAVVQPLIDRQKTFDLAATVWLRTSKDASHINGTYASKGDTASADIDEEVEHLTEESLFSDIIFRGVKLSDKNLHTTVNFTVPTALFRHVNLTNYDLRGSVMLIPTSPSLMDYTTNYSSYIPETVNMLPVRSWPFPLGSHHTYEKALSDMALESFAVTVPLIQFHGIRSRCTPPIHNRTAKVSDFEDFDVDVDPLALLESPQASGSPAWPIPISSLELTNGQDPLKAHPYIVTRTHIRMLDEDRLIDFNAFLKAHRKLKQSSCGRAVLTQPNQYFCKGLHRTNGNWETLLQLRVPDKSTGRSIREWAYAPYFYLSRYGLGQKDLLEIPVERENCTEPRTEETPPEEPASIDVSWKVSYIGRTAAKMSLADIFEEQKWHPFNTTDDAIAFEHDKAEMTRP
ncbi:hypothetical protein C0991_005837 [Blastosporella zonata]|nr:hypothetical protein C0991_005837 [Blastosporella zonata]